jgi:formylglycine-generating enzyme required for sulfatase activity
LAFTSCTLPFNADLWSIARQPVASPAGGAVASPSPSPNPPAPSYALAYDANGADTGSVPVDGGSYLAGASATAAGNTGALAKAGCYWAGWNTRADGGGTKYLPGASLAMPAGGQTLYAQWQASSGISLSALSVAGPMPGALTFDSATLSYSLGVVPRQNYIAFTATGNAVASSTLSYSWNGKNASLASGTTSPNLSLADGDNTLSITVSDPGGLYHTSYSIAVYRMPQTTSPQGIVMVQVPAGSYQRDSGPTNINTVSAFTISRDPITRSQYRAVMGIGSDLSAQSSGLQDPVNMVNWYDALLFCNTLSVLEGLTPVYRIGGSTDPTAWGSVPTADNLAWNAASADWSANGYRLPTRAEYVWAAMGATRDSQPGNMAGGVNTGGWDKPFAGYNGSNAAALGDYVMYSVNCPGTTIPVGSKLPNELGIYDLSGNVFDWCWDSEFAASGSGTRIDYRSRPSNGNVRPTSGNCLYGGANSAALNVSYGGIQTWNRTNGHGIRVARGAIAVPRTGLVGEWLFRDAGAGTAVDSSGQGSDATVSGTPTAGASHGGIANASYFFDGDAAPSQQIAISDANPRYFFSSASAFSISCWVKPSALSFGHPAYFIDSWGSYAPSLGFQYSLAISSAGNAFTARIGKKYDGLVVGQAVAPSACTAGTWYHLVMVCDPGSTTLSLYKDGALAGTASTISGVEASVLHGLRFGKSDNWVNNLDTFQGSLDSIRVYNRALTAAEVLALYQE